MSEDRWVKRLLSADNFRFRGRSIEGGRMPGKRVTKRQWAEAIHALKQAKPEVWNLIDSDGEDPEPLLTQLVPLAETVAEYEGHHDFTRILERELEL